MELQDSSFKIIKNFKQSLWPSMGAWVQDPEGPHEVHAHEAGSETPSQKGLSTLMPSMLLLRAI